MKKFVVIYAICLAFLPFSINAQSSFVDSKLYYPNSVGSGVRLPAEGVVQVGSGSGNANTGVISQTPPTNSSANSGGGVSGSNLRCEIRDFKSVVTCFGSIINTIIPIIIALTVLFITWNIFKLIKSGDGENLKGIKDIIIWGVIGLFCMLSIWGFVAILSNTFDLNKNPITPEPFKISN